MITTSTIIGLILTAISVSRVMYVRKYGFELRYRAWVKLAIGGFYGAMTALGVCMMMGLVW